MKLLIMRVKDHVDINKYYKLDTDFIHPGIRINLVTDDAYNPSITKYRIEIEHSDPAFVTKPTMLNNTSLMFRVEGYVRGKYQHDELESVLDFLCLLTEYDFNLLDKSSMQEILNFPEFSYVSFIGHVERTMNPDFMTIRQATRIREKMDDSDESDLTNGIFIDSSIEDIINKN